jgi:hypothetical protein
MSGQIKLKWIPKKNGSSNENAQIPKSNQNVESQEKRYPTYKKYPPPSKWSSYKAYKSVCSKNYPNRNSQIHHPPLQVRKIKNATTKMPNI